MTGDFAATAPLCQAVITAAGLPARSDLLLERERNLFALMDDRLHGRRAEHAGADLPPVPLADLLMALAARDGVTLPAATWLAGRCQPDGTANQAALTAAVAGVVAALPVAALDVWAWSYIEAAFTLALRGDPAAAHAALLPLVSTAPDPAESYLAAFYLAQLGDPRGWPIMLQALRSPTAHTRLMALRHLAGFLSYDGQPAGDQPIAIRAALVARLADHDGNVRVEVPYYLVEAGVPDLPALLAPVAAHDPDPNVRLAAESALAAVAATDGA